jgi:hypothetical protein
MYIYTRGTFNGESVVSTPGDVANKGGTWSKFEQAKSLNPDNWENLLMSFYGPSGRFPAFQLCVYAVSYSFIVICLFLVCFYLRLLLLYIMII